MLWGIGEPGMPGFGSVGSAVNPHHECSRIPQAGVDQCSFPGTALESRSKRHSAATCREQKFCNADSADDDDSRGCSRVRLLLGTLVRVSPARPRNPRSVREDLKHSEIARSDCDERLAFIRGPIRSRCRLQVNANRCRRRRARSAAAMMQTRDSSGRDRRTP